MSTQINISDHSEHPLNILDPPETDESIEEYEYFDYEPQSQHNLDTSSTIQIDMNAHDIWALPSESYLVIKGNVVRNDNNNPFAANDEIALVNNAMMYLFSEITYSINNTTIEKLSHPGFTTSIMNYLTQPGCDYCSCVDLLSCWAKDTSNSADSNRSQEAGAVPDAHFRSQKIKF